MQGMQVSRVDVHTFQADRSMRWIGLEAQCAVDDGWRSESPHHRTGLDQVGVVLVSLRVLSIKIQQLGKARIKATGVQRLDNQRHGCIANRSPEDKWDAQAGQVGCDDRSRPRIIPGGDGITKTLVRNQCFIKSVANLLGQEGVLKANLIETSSYLLWDSPQDFGYLRKMIGNKPDGNHNVKR